MTSKLFGCVVSSIDNIVIVGQPTIGYKGLFHSYLIQNENNNYALKYANQYSSYDGHIDDGFGISCKINKVNDNYNLIIGAHRQFNSHICTGSAYIFSSKDGKTWKHIAKLLPHKLNHKTMFGGAVDITSQYAVVGAFCDNTEGWKAGAIHLFKENIDDKTKRIKWNHFKVIYPNILPNNNSLHGLFGFSLSLKDNMLAVGAPGENSNGKTYLFYSNNEWDNIETHTITNNNKFGFSVCLTNKSLIVGAPGENGNAGSTYIYNLLDFFDISHGFVPSSTPQVKKLETSSNSSKPLFGRSVCANDNYAVVSGFGKKNNETHIGSAFIYNIMNDLEEPELIANLRDTTTKELFGHSVFLNNNFVFVGDPSTDTVHIFNINDLLNSDIKKWYGASLKINPLPSYKIEA
tara:strand:- start:4960 stop:6174 length:1215 start_codon:yes stop_codon:yes gene_type:complete